MIYAVSMSRPQNVAPTKALVDAEPWWVVPERQHRAYRKAGAKHLISDGVGGAISVARNAAIEHFLSRGDGDWFTVMDDDVKMLGFVSWDDAGKYHVESLTVADWVEMLPMVHQATGAFMVGPLYSANPFYASPKVAVAAFSGALQSIHRRVLEDGHRYDESLPMSEDIEMVARVVSQYGTVARLNWVIIDPQHHQAGGLQDYFLPDVRAATDAATTKRLVSLYPNLLMEHPKRTGALAWRRNVVL
jgi:hypothetical protein